MDSEIICHLVEDQLRLTSDLLAAVTQSVSRLRGSWAFVILDGLTHRMVAAAHRSPLLAARSHTGLFLASDLAAFGAGVEDFYIVNDGDIVEVTDDFVWTHDGSPIPAPHAIACPPRTIGRAALDGNHHMADEIDEQPEAAARILQDIGGGIADGGLWRGSGSPHSTACACSPAERHLMPGTSSARRSGAWADWRAVALWRAKRLARSSNPAH